jgi:hypothetical protein
MGLIIVVRHTCHLLQNDRTTLPMTRGDRLGSVRLGYVSVPFKLVFQNNMKNQLILSFSHLYIRLLDP